MRNRLPSVRNAGGIYYCREVKDPDKFWVIGGYLDTDYRFGGREQRWIGRPSLTLLESRITERLVEVHKDIGRFTLELAKYIVDQRLPDQLKEETKVTIGRWAVFQNHKFSLVAFLDEQSEARAKDEQLAVFDALHSLSRDDYSECDPTTVLMPYRPHITAGFMRGDTSSRMVSEALDTAETLLPRGSEVVLKGISDKS